MSSAAAAKGPRIIVRRRELAELMGTHPDAISRHVASGMPVLTRDTRGRAVGFDAIACLAWERQRGNGASGDVSLQQARTRKELALAVKHELENRRRAAELLEASDVEAVWSERVLAAREHLLAIPGISAARGLVGPEHVDALTGLIHDALRELGTEAL